MKLQSTVFAIAAASLALSACGSADDENSLGGTFTKSFDEGWNTEFVKGCVAEAAKVGAAESDAKPMCECVAEDLSGRLDGITEKMNPPQDKMDAALKSCGIEI